MKPTVLFLESVDPAAYTLLPSEDYGVILPGVESVDYGAVNAIVTRGKGEVDRPLIDRCPALRVIVRCGVGVNNIDVDYATTHGVQVLNVPGVNAATVAEHTLGLMLMLVRGMYRLVQEVKQGNWDYRTTYAGKELRDLRLGIVGRGDIGKRVGGAAGALHMEVSYARRHRGDTAEGHLPLVDLLAQSDVVSLHVPLTSETHNLIDADALARMQPGSYLINTARGEIVDAAALLDALERGQLAGYASDLLSGEGEVQRRLVAHPGVLITPHAASLTALTFRELSERGVRHVVEYLGGGAIGVKYRVNML
ncbi:2-hydroxyacid dehydrogenase [Neolewinella sp.]|uniref:2-hydroxyacid dehydrogenase n=1 Tax=Neolewinella sp. TaxID=2993543 RepID=UPI003B51820A